MAFVVFGLLSAATSPSSCSAVGGGGCGATLAPVVIAEEVLSSGGNCCCGFIGSRSLPSTSGVTLFLFNSPLRRYAEEDAAVANCNMNWGCKKNRYNQIIGSMDYCHPLTGASLLI